MPRVHQLSAMIGLAICAVAAGPLQAAPVTVNEGSAHAVAEIAASNHLERTGLFGQTINQAFNLYNVVYHFDGLDVGYTSRTGEWKAPPPPGLLDIEGEQSVTTNGTLEIFSRAVADASTLGTNRAFASALNIGYDQGWRSEAHGHTRWADTFVTYDPLAALGGVGLSGQRIAMSFDISTHVAMLDLDGAGAGRAEFNVFIGLHDFATDTFEWKAVHGRGTQTWGSGEWTDTVGMDFEVTAGVPYEIVVDFNVHAWDNAIADAMHTAKVQSFVAPDGYVTTSSGLVFGAATPGNYGGLATPVALPSSTALVTLALLAIVGASQRRASPRCVAVKNWPVWAAAAAARRSAGTWGARPAA